MTQRQDTETPHFQRLATDYNLYRTLDMEPITFLADSIEGSEHSVCSIGCGTGRYIMPLVEQMQSNGVNVTRAVGIDPQSEHARSGKRNRSGGRAEHGLESRSV